MRSTRVPRPLLALLAVVALVGVGWSLLQPPFQVTDEDVHFTYVHALGEHGTLPGEVDGFPYAGELYAAMDVSNARAANFSLLAKPERSRAAYEDWRAREQALSRDDGGGPTGAAGYPPAYYLSLVPAYAAAGGGDVFTRVIAARLGSVLWLLAATIGAWLLAGEMFGRRRRLQLVCAATVGLWPMLVYVSAGVNPDAMQAAVWTWAFWMAARLLRHGPTARDALAFGALVGLALVCKATSLALLPPAALVLLIVAWRALRSDGVARAAAAVAPALLAAAVPALAWVLLAAEFDRPPYGQAGVLTTESPDGAGTKPFQWSEFVRYVWQFYLPRLPSQTPFDIVNEVISNNGLHNVWFGQFFGVFGWTNVWFPRWAYDVFLVVLALLAAAAVAGAVRAVRAAGRRQAARRALPWVVVFGGAVLTLLGGLHMTEYRQNLAGAGPFMQGRYLLPLIGLFGLFVAAAVNALPRRAQGVAAGLVLGALLAYQLGALGVLLGRFYA